MTKEEYFKLVEDTKNQVKGINKALNEAKDVYIESNKQCEVDTNVEIVLNSGRVVKGVVKSFGILQDGYVYPTSYESNKKKLYISSAPQKVTIL